MAEYESKKLEVNEEALPTGGYRYTIKKADFDVLVTKKMAEHEKKFGRNPPKPLKHRGA